MSLLTKTVNGADTTQYKRIVLITSIVVVLPFLGLLYYYLQTIADYFVYDLIGLNKGKHLTQSINFFIYDTLKILILLFLISSLMGVVNAYFPVERLRLYLTTKKNVWAPIPAGIIFWSCYSFLFLFIYPFVYRICKRWDTSGRNFCIFNNITLSK